MSTKDYTKTCEWCEQPFSTSMIHARYCSSRHRAAAYDRRNRQRYHSAIRQIQEFSTAIAALDDLTAYRLWRSVVESIGSEAIAHEGAVRAATLEYQSNRAEGGK